MGTTPLERSALGAVVVHALLLFGFGRVPPRAQAPLPADRAAVPLETEIRIETEPDPLSPSPPAAPPPAARSESVPHAGAVATRDAFPRGHDARRRAPADARELAPESATVEVAPEGSAQTWTFSPSVAGSVWLGTRTSPDAALAAMPGAPASTSSPESAAPGRGAQDSMRAALAEHDRQVGLGAGSPLVTPTRDAVRTSLVPDFAHAMLEFTTDRTGLVVSVRVLDSSSDRRAWEEVADQLAAATRKKSLRVAPGAKGVAITMEVESKVATVTGKDARKSVIGQAIDGASVSECASMACAGVPLDPTDLLTEATSKPRRTVVARVVREDSL